MFHIKLCQMGNCASFRSIERHTIDSYLDSKPPTQSPKQRATQKLILSYFNNVTHLIPQLIDNEMIRIALVESSKVLPYIITSRKAVKTYLKVSFFIIVDGVSWSHGPRQRCLELWSTAEDSVRMAAFLALRKLASASDDAILDTVLKVGFSC